MANKKLSEVTPTDTTKNSDYIHVVVEGTPPLSRRILRRDFLNSGVSEKDADFTLAADDNGAVFIVDATSDVTVNLPNSATVNLPDGFSFTVKAVNTGSALLVKNGATDTINGSATIKQGSSAGIVKHGTTPCTWEVFGNIELTDVVTADAILTDDQKLVRSDGIDGRKVQQTGIGVSDTNVMTGANIGIKSLTGAYTLIASDNNKMLLINSASAVNLTLPPDVPATGALPTGFNCSVKNNGTADVTIVGTGVTISGPTKIKQNYTVGIVKTGGNKYDIAGGDMIGEVEIGEIADSDKSGGLNAVKLITGTGTTPAINKIPKFDNQGNLIDSGITGANVVTPTSVHALTNKTFDANGAGNSLSNVEADDLKSSAKTGTGSKLATTNTDPTADRLYRFNTTKDLVATGIAVDSDDVVTGANVDVNSQSGTSYTLAASDNNKVVVLSSNSSTTLTLPSAAGLPVGFNCIVKYTGTASVTVTKENAGHTLTGATAIGTGHALGIVKTAADEWHTFGGDLISKSGTGNELVTTTTDELVDGNIGKFDANENLIDGGLAASKLVTAEQTLATANALARVDAGTNTRKIKQTGILVSDQDVVTGANVSVDVKPEAAYTLVQSDNNKVLIFTASGNVTVTLPTGIAAGFNCTLKYTGSNTVTVTSPDTITGKTEIKPNYSLGIVRATATTWHTFGGGLIEKLVIDDIASTARSGTDSKLITGTAGDENRLGKFDANDDLIGTGIEVDSGNVMTRANTGINHQSGTAYTLAEADNNRLIVFDSAAAVTLTLPQQSTESLPAGFNCAVKNINVGTVTLETEGTDTMNGADTIKNGQSAAIVRRGTTTWEVMGGNRQRSEVFAFIMRGRTGNDTYRLVLKVPFAGIITETVTKSKSGTATAQFKIGDTNLGGTVNAVSSTRNAQAHTTNNAFSAGDDIEMEITGAGSGNSRPEHLAISIKYTRDL